jgi:LacI family transcriptional regulator
MKVSRGTVRRGLERLVRDGLLVREAGRGYSLPGPDAAPRGEPGRGTVLFVHCHPEERLTDGKRHAKIWAGAREEATRAGLLTLISSIPEEELTARKAEELAKVAGGVLCDHVAPDSMRALLGAGIPAVQLDYYRNPGVPVDAVVQDDAGGIELAVAHLLGRGHRRIGYLDTTDHHRRDGRPLNAARRLLGFRTACVDAGPAVEGLEEPVGASGPIAADVGAAVAKLLRRGATALVIPHSDPWSGARAALADQGIEMPGDFGVVLWGGDQVAEGEVVPTYVTWSKEQMGREGVRRLLLKMDRQNIEPATVVVPASLVDRGTGGRGPAA